MVTLTADFSKRLRPMGKLNGMNNGPLHTHMDATDLYQNMGVDFVRFHETHSMDTKCIEIPFVFPNFEADEYDENNYYFAETDAVIAAAVASGIEIMYRFGMGTEATKPKLFCLCPTDYEKWGRIVIQVLKHYNEGWANGFHYGIKWCEIWNEADLFEYWPGPYEEYIKFYAVTSKMLREYDPTLLICPSGFAACIPDKPAEDAPDDVKEKYAVRYKFFHGLLDTIVNENLPLDCFPWHTYTYNSAQTQHKLDGIKEMLAMHGLKDIDLINTEWGPITLKRDRFGRWDTSQYDTIRSTICLLASMLVMQHYGNSRAAYYDADPRSSLSGLYEYGNAPKRHYYAMVAFKMLRDGKWEYHTEGETDTVRICASCSGEKAYIAVTAESEESIRLKALNLGKAKVNYYLIDENTNLKLVKRGSFSGNAISLDMKEHSAYLLEFELVH